MRYAGCTARRQISITVVIRPIVAQTFNFTANTVKENHRDGRTVQSRRVGLGWPIYEASDGRPGLSRKTEYAFYYLYGDDPNKYNIMLCGRNPFPSLVFTNMSDDTD